VQLRQLTNAGPPPVTYLDRPYPRKQKGGTLLARGVRTLEEQLRALADPDRVRPAVCPTCRAHGMHVHERRERVLAGEINGPPHIGILIFRCADEDCGAVWRILPEFLARHLWRRWTLVGVALGSARPGQHAVPARTLRRWRARLAMLAAVLVVLLGQSSVASHVALARGISSGATRGEVAEGLGGLTNLAESACLFHHLAPGVRLM